MGDLLSGFGDIVFTLVIGYIGAIEFLYVVRHLYHWSFNHDGPDNENDADSLARLQDNMRQQLANARATEANAGKNAMQDGVLYQDGFRIDPDQAAIDNLAEQLKNKSDKDLKRQELERELDKQKKIAEKTRKELELAEADAARQQRMAEENERKMLEAEQQRERAQKQHEEEEKRKAEEAERKRHEEEQQRRAAEERKLKEAEDNARKQHEEEEKRKAVEEQQKILIEAERKAQEEEQQRRLEEDRKLKEAEEEEENARLMVEAERLKEQQQRQAEEDAEREENERRILEAERQMEEAQRQAEELEENERKFLDIERNLEEQMRDSENDEELTDNERQLIASIKQREVADQHDEASAQKEAELLKRILQAREQLGEESEEEQSQRLFGLEQDRELKQRRIDENTRLFLKAEKEMADLQELMQDAVEKREFGSNLESAPQTPAVEEPCIKKTFYPLHDESLAPPVSHVKVKTQLAQNSDDSYSVSKKSLLFPGVSDDASSNEPISSQQSSFSTQPSEEVATSNESQYPQQERQEPEGEDTAPSQQYSDDYLRSLDGIKSRPLSREDRSGRRIAFKKRRSSGSSNSSRDSRTSRDEELKMFTSLEEEEMKSTGESEFTPIRYSSEPTLKVKGHNRRHKRSPAKDMKLGDDSLRGSLERLGEETTNPWGDVVPEHYKDTEFWKREKALSIDEEHELEKPTSSEEINYDTATNLPSASSFEEATQIQNEEALSNLKKQENKDTREEESENKATKDEATRSDNNTNLQTSPMPEKEASPSRSSASPRLRRSPRIEEIDQYEERWKESNESPSTAQGSTVNTPTIIVQKPLDFSTWRDEHGLIMEGLSDFYDFTASVNPSRSRSTSRNPSPTNTAPSTPQPRNVSFQTNNIHNSGSSESHVEIYDDTDQLQNHEFSKENIAKFLDSMQENEPLAINEDMASELSPEVAENSIKNHLQYVIDDQPREKGNNFLVPMVNVMDDSTDTASNAAENDDNDDMNALVASLRSQRSRSRSRSKSPLPTAGNIQRSLETRRNRMIRHNEDILEKLIESNLLPASPDPPSSAAEDDDCSKENMSLLVESLRAERSRSRSRSRCRSPLPSSENIAESVERVEESNQLFRKFSEQMHTSEIPVIFNAPLVSIEITELDSIPSQKESEDEDCSRENMDSLVQSLRVARSRSRSKSPMRLPTAENLSKSLETRRSKLIEINDGIMQELEERARTPEPPQLTVEYVYEFVETAEESTENSSRSRLSRSRTPSRSPPQRRISPDSADGTPISRNPSRPLSPTQADESHDLNFHVMLNLEGSQNKTLSKNSEEYESTLADRLKQMDEEALEKLKNASEEIELRTLSPLILDQDEAKEREGHDLLTGLPSTERRKMLRCSPTTPDYDRTISEEMKDVDRIKQEMLDSGFKRSTYVGESMDLVGREYDSLRREAARFQRSRSPTPSLSETDIDPGQITAAEKRHIQDLVLAELTGSSEMRNTGAIPKAAGLISTDSETSLSTEVQDTLRIKEEILSSGFQRSTYVGQSVDASLEFEEMRRRNAEFRRSASKSRSPLGDTELAEIAAIESESTKREFQDKVLDEISNTSMNFQDFSRHLNPNFLDNERRASDSALIQKPSILVQLQDKDIDDQGMEPEEYHHFRRFSLAQEQPMEDYPSDDYIFIQQVEVRTRSGSRTWIREDFYSQDIDDFLVKDSTKVSQESIQGAAVHVMDESEVKAESEAGISQSRKSSPETGVDEVAATEAANEDVGEVNLDEIEDDEDSNGSEDDRRTVIDVDDEIDEDISDFNDRGPAEESHHEQSECEEAEREMDRYAGRGASDWANVVDVGEILSTEEPQTEDSEGAVGGASSSPYDSDSFAIDQIYDEAIKNRKQSGILREFDCILNEMTNSSIENSSRDMDEQCALWSKTHKKPKNIEFSNSFIESERRDTEMRYLGDATVSARQSTRLRSRYGYNPVLQSSTIPDDIEVDMNYRPKREYNWRKNFKLSDDDASETKERLTDIERSLNDQQVDWDLDGSSDMTPDTLDMRKFSLGGESITLFSQSPETNLQTEEADPVYQELEECNDAQMAQEIVEEKVEKPKKKKTKKKTRKGSKGSVEVPNPDDDNDIDDYVPPAYSRRSSSIQMDTDSPKRKSRSRRSSRTSLTNDDSFGLYSPRSSVGYADPIADIMEEYSDVKETVRPKKIKKRKKVKEVMADVTESPKEDMMNVVQDFEATASAVITPDSVAASTSAHESVCGTPGSVECGMMNVVQDFEATASAVITPDSVAASTSAILSPQESVCGTPGSVECGMMNVAQDFEATASAVITPDSVAASTSAILSPQESVCTPGSVESETSSNRTSHAPASTTPTTPAPAPVDAFDILKDANFYPLF